MADKLWFIQWDIGIWLKDPRVSLLKPATRGIWFDAICVMHELDQCGQLVGTVADLARVCRSTPNELRAALDDLKQRNAADVDERDGNVTLTCRRMRRSWTGRKSSRNRQQRKREKDVTSNVTVDVTPPVTPLSRGQLEVRGKNEEEPIHPAATDYPPGFMRVWDAAPRKGRSRSSKVQAFAEWKRLRLEMVTDAVLAGLERWKLSDEWRKDNGEYVGGLHLWLKNRKWDELAMTATTSPHGGDW